MSVNILQDTCLHEEYLSNSCLIISKPFYTAFIFLSCVDTETQTNENIGFCFDPSYGTMGPYVNIYFRGGMWISTNNKEKFNDSLPYFNAPATDRNKYVLPLKPNKNIIFYSAEVYKSPVELYNVTFLNLEKKVENISFNNFSDGFFNSSVIYTATNETFNTLSRKNYSDNENLTQSQATGEQNILVYTSIIFGVLFLICICNRFRLYKRVSSWLNKSFNS